MNSGADNHNIGAVADLRSIRVGKTTIIGLIALSGLGIWVFQQRQLDDAQRVLLETQVQQAKLEARVAAARANLEAARREGEVRSADREQTLVAMLRARQELEKVDPESRWAEAPSGSPEWDDTSPYLWVRKAILPRVSLPLFATDGSLQSDVAGVLALEPGTQQSLNDQLQRMLREYRARVIAQAAKIDQALPGIGGQGTRVTVRIDWLPEERGRLKQQFQAALRTELGAQRAELLMENATAWFDSECGGVGTDPMIVSIIRHPNGTYDLSSRSGNGSSLSRGASSVEGNIPPYLRPLFAEVLEESRSADPSSKAGP